ncbi:hypothetical protein SAMN05421781_2870 [Marinococcus luteus]|uniref:Uncharacterized protein n=1 Tax=Marinococcus luteus TaxID=1122204 RepID=A0A1H2XR38_9BACI|nr:hypothetical protein [Marinococcus luteus]SDW95168.1 hypothetical protein SAMN05421781_2870 [Marinococcus luteus]
MNKNIGNKAGKSNRLFFKITKRPLLSSSIVYGVMLTVIAIIGIAGKEKDTN